MQMRRFNREVEAVRLVKDRGVSVTDWLGAVPNWKIK